MKNVERTSDTSVYRLKDPRGACRKAFERMVRKEWNVSWRGGLARNSAGAYQFFDLQMSWHNFQEGWKRGRVHGR
jgi:hypothetical protein